MQERVSFYIDGVNFYHLVLKKLKVAEQDFDYDAFVSHLAGDRLIVPMGKRIYVGTVREREGDERSKEAMSKQRRFFTQLQGTQWEIKTSKLRTRREEIRIDDRVEDYKKLLSLGITSVVVEKPREKGIDVKLATDVIVGAVDHKYDTAVVISSDADLIPALDWVRSRKMAKIEYVGFSIPDAQDPTKSTRPLMSLMNRTDIQRTLAEADLRQFIRPKLEI